MQAYEKTTCVQGYLSKGLRLKHYSKSSPGEITRVTVKVQKRLRVTSYRYQIQVLKYARFLHRDEFLNIKSLRMGN